MRYGIILTFNWQFEIMNKQKNWLSIMILIDTFFDELGFEKYGNLYVSAEKFINDTEAINIVKQLFKLNKKLSIYVQDVKLVRIEEINDLMDAL